MAGYAKCPECGDVVETDDDGDREVFAVHSPEFAAKYVKPGRVGPKCSGSGWLIEDEDRR